MIVHFGSFLLVLGLLRSCFTGSIQPRSLKYRLCHADYVFKFQVASGMRNGCRPNSSQKPRNSRVTSPGVTTSPSPVSQATPPPNQVGCYVVSRQDIQIYRKDIYKGADDLKQMDAVKTVVGKDYHDSFVRHSLNFKQELKNGSYVFVGRKVANLELRSYNFQSNPYTVEPWNATVKNQVKNFDFNNHC